MAVASKSEKRTRRPEWEGEWDFDVRLLPLDRLFADDRYQRDAIEPFIESKVATFDPTLVGTLDVSERPGEEYAILDGLQRSEICRRVGKNSVWCATYTGMSVGGEAAHFSNKNKERRNMHPYYVLRARKVAGEKGPREIFSVVEATGFKLASSGARENKEAIVAIAAVEEVHGMSSLVRPTGHLRVTLETVRESFFGRDSATEGTVIRGIGRFWNAFRDDEVVLEHLWAQLGEVGPVNLRGYAADRASSSQRPKAYWVAEEIVRLYNKKLPREQKLSVQFLSKPRVK